MNMLTTNKRIELFLNMMNQSGKQLISPEFMNWLTANGFFTQAASTKYHGNYEGGLFDHSFTVTEQLVRFTDRFGLNWARPESPWITGMFHDLCKIDNYSMVVEEEGIQFFGSDEVKGRQVHFEYNNDCILKGHAEKSIILLSQFMTLTEEEIMCIRFHMGAYEGQAAWDAYDKAIRKYETVLWVHTADMYASKVLDC
jgi:hypothetical protein